MSRLIILLATIAILAKLFSMVIEDSKDLQENVRKTFLKGDSYGK